MHIFAPLTSEQEPRLQQIEIASSFQLPGFTIVGLPSPEVAEARERIRAALESSGFSLPKRRIVVNLSPASIKKRGTGLDLAMALAVLSLNHPKKKSELRVAAWGELGLDAQVRSAGQPARALYATWEAKIPFLFLADDELDRMKVIEQWIQKARYFDHAPPRPHTRSFAISGLGLPPKTLHQSKLSFCSLRILESKENSRPTSKSGGSFPI
jgi:hypothetical protein